MKRDEHLRTATGLYTSAIRFEKARHATRASCSSRNQSVRTCLGIAPCISTATITFHFQSHYSTLLLLVARLTTHLGLVHTNMPPCSRQALHINGRDGPLCLTSGMVGACMHAASEHGKVPMMIGATAMVVQSTSSTSPTTTSSFGVSQR